MNSGSAMKGRNGELLWAGVLGGGDMMCEGETGVHEAGGHRSILHHALAPAEFNKTQNK